MKAVSNVTIFFLICFTWDFQDKPIVSKAENYFRPVILAEIDVVLVNQNGTLYENDFFVQVETLSKKKERDCQYLYVAISPL